MKEVAWLILVEWTKEDQNLKEIYQQYNPERKTI